MANHKKLQKHSEEYQLKDEEFAQDSVEEKPARRGLKNVLLSRKWLALLGLMIAIVVVYQFISRSTVKEEPQITGQVVAPISTEIQPTPEVQPSVVQTVSTPVPTPSPSVTAGLSAQDQFSVLNQQVQQNQNQIQQLQMNMQQLQTSMTNLNKQIIQLNTTVMAARAPTVVQAPVGKATKSLPQKRVVYPRYYVKALVPGRAWLYTNRDQLLTVKVGDFLPGYGTVQRISPTDGKVWMSWGTIFTYGKNYS